MSLHTGTVKRPRFESAPYRPTPGSREHLFGRVQGLSDIRRPAFINRIAQVLKGSITS